MLAGGTFIDDPRTSESVRGGGVGDGGGEHAVVQDVRPELHERRRRRSQPHASHARPVMPVASVMWFRRGDVERALVRPRVALGVTHASR